MAILITLVSEVGNILSMKLFQLVLILLCKERFSVFLELNKSYGWFSNLVPDSFFVEPLSCSVYKFPYSSFLSTGCLLRNEFVVKSHNRRVNPRYCYIKSHLRYMIEFMNQFETTPKEGRAYQITSFRKGKMVALMH